MLLSIWSVFWAAVEFHLCVCQMSSYVTISTDSFSSLVTSHPIIYKMMGYLLETRFYLTSLSSASVHGRHVIFLCGDSTLLYPSSLLPIPSPLSSHLFLPSPLALLSPLSSHLFSLSSHLTLLYSLSSLSLLAPLSISPLSSLLYPLSSPFLMYIWAFEYMYRRHIAYISRWQFYDRGVLLRSTTGHRIWNDLTVSCRFLI